jgi:hypothetical protein
MFTPDQDAVDMGAEENRNRRDLDKISKVCNRFMQAQDPFIQRRYESFCRTQNRHKSESENYRQIRLRNARSRTDLVSDFLEKRGIAYGVRP